MTRREQLIEQWIRPAVRALSAYHVPPAQGLIKLDAMENPYRWPPALVADWQQRLSAAAINRYPDASGAAVKEGLRRAMAIGDEQAILLGNGSDEIIQILAMAVAQPGRTVMAPEPGFVMYRMIATFAGLDYVGVPLDENFDLDLPAMLEAIERHRPALLFLALPNNPTGNLFSPDRVDAVIDACPGLVILDEAYTAFTDADHLAAAERDNVLVMRTLSKVGLAGLRLGLLVGHPQWVEQLEKLRLPYNINVLTQLSAEFALDHFDMLRAQTEDIRRERESLSAALRRSAALSVWPSEANFLLVRCEPGRAGAVHEALRERGILVKCLDGSHPLLVDCLRLTVGSPEENAALLEALQASA